MPKTKTSEDILKARSTVPSAVEDATEVAKLLDTSSPAHVELYRQWIEAGRTIAVYGTPTKTGKWGSTVRILPCSGTPGDTWHDAGSTQEWYLRAWSKTLPTWLAA